MKFLSILATSLAALSLAASSFAEVIVVPPVVGQFNPLQGAIASAQPGDILLIQGDYTPAIDLEQPGNFFNLLNIDKSLTLVGDGGSIGAVRIRNLGPDDQVVLRGLTIGPIVGSTAWETQIQAQSGVAVVNCAGVVAIEDCFVRGGKTESGTPPAGIRVRDADQVIVSRCTVEGADFAGVHLPGAGMRVKRARVAVYHSTFEGGLGEQVPPLPVFTYPDTPGGAGLIVESSPEPDTEVLLYGATIRGGDGGTGCSASTADDCVGGAGLVLIGPARVRAVDSTWTGGDGGTVIGVGSAPDGEDLAVTPLLPDALPHALFAWDDEVPVFEGPGILREGQADTLTIRGTPGELARFYFALELAYAPLPQKKGLFASATPYIGPVIVGTFPASGAIEIPLVGPDLSSIGVDGVLTSWQAYARVAGTPELVLSNPHELLLLASGF